MPINDINIYKNKSKYTISKYPINKNMLINIQSHIHNIY